MLFNTPVFIIFFVFLFIGYFFCYHFFLRFLKGYLILGSIFFYGYWNVNFVPILVLSCCVNYYVGGLIKNSLRRQLLRNLGIAFNLGLLCFFKYTDFLISNVNGLLGVEYPLLHVALPLGISFFTFQQIAYLYDVAAGKSYAISFLDYSLFVTFFPQLIAGPIVHHNEMMPQFSEGNLKIDQDDILRGGIIFSIGLGKKVLLADPLAVYVGQAFNCFDKLTFFDSWGGAVAYSMQLYFDFSGYCDMAMGLGLILGIRLPLNFNSPYRSVNIQDFWRRWHMTLSHWLKDYLYIPLGGNRHGHTRTALNGIIVFTLGGLWHGAAWTFVLWGLLHGIALTFFAFWKQFKFELPKFFSHALTFVFVTLAWVMFRAPSFDVAKTYYYAMIGGNGFKVSTHVAHVINDLRFILIPVHGSSSMSLDLSLVPLLFVASCCAFFMPNSSEYSGYTARLGVQYKILSSSFVVYSAFLLALSFSFLNSPSEFIYFNF